MISRRDAVLHYLTERLNQWVNGPELANAEVGGSEGLKRLRELRADGYPIEQRRHPNGQRSVHQYRLTSVEPVRDPASASWTPPAVSPLRDNAPLTGRRSCPTCGAMLYEVTPMLGGFSSAKCPTHGRIQIRD